jgi:type VI secretion system protein ImpI
MPLTLKITSAQKDVLGPDRLKVFSVHGGSIGRAGDNEWVLPDPDLYISGHHALIDYRDGAYYLTDTSTNGVFVNDADLPVGKGSPIRLYDGDRLRMGNYELAVSIVNVSRDGTNDTGIFIADDEDTVVDPETPEEAAAPASPRVLDDPIDLAASNTGRPDFEMVERDESPAIPATAASGDKPAHPALSGSVSEGDPVSVLCRAIGIERERIEPGSEQQFISTVGHLVRTATRELMDLLRARTRIKGELKLAQTAEQPRENNPLKFSSDVDEALDKMFFYSGVHHLPPLDAIESAMLDVRAHQHAVVAAMRAAFDDLLGRFEPETLRQKFDRGLRPGALLGMSNEAKYWDLFQEYYASVRKNSDQSFDEIVGQVFIQAYDAEIRRLSGESPDEDAGA